MFDGLILRHLVVYATASRTPRIPSSFQRCNVAPLTTPSGRYAQPTLKGGRALAGVAQL